MKRLHFYVIKSFIGPFIMTFFICIFILLMQFLWRYLDDMVGKGLENAIIVELMSYAAMSVIPMALPLAVLLASIMTFGTLGERFELLAIKASGVSLLRFMRPLIVLSAIISIVAYFLANDVVPVTNSKFAALLVSVKRQRPEMIIKEGVFSNDLDGYSIKVGRRNQKTNTLEDIIIYDHTKNKGNIMVTLADSGNLIMTDDKQYMILTLFSGESYNEVQPTDRSGKSNNPFRHEKFRKEVIVIKMEGMELNRMDEKYFKDLYRMLSNEQLTIAIDSLYQIYHEREKAITLGASYSGRLNSDLNNAFRPDSMQTPAEAPPTYSINFDSIFSHLEEQNKKSVLSSAQALAQANQRVLLQFEPELTNKLRWINKHAIEWHKKYAWSIACLIFFFIGAPLGAIIRKGGFGMPVVVSILMFISYYLVSMIGEKVAREGVYEVGSAVWVATIVFFPVGIFLTYKAVTDSMLLTSEAYTRLLKRLNIFRFLKSKKKRNNEDSGSLQ